MKIQELARRKEPRAGRILVAGLLFAAAPTSAFAYIDPNAGGLLLQLLGSLFVAIGSLWLMGRQKLSKWWAIVTKFFRARSK